MMRWKWVQQNIMWTQFAWLKRFWWWRNSLFLFYCFTGVITLDKVGLGFVSFSYLHWIFTMRNLKNVSRFHYIWVNSTLGVCKCSCVFVCVCVCVCCVCVVPARSPVVEIVIILSGMFMYLKFVKKKRCDENEDQNILNFIKIYNQSKIKYHLPIQTFGHYTFRYIDQTNKNRYNWQLLCVINFCGAAFCHNIKFRMLSLYIQRTIYCE